MFRGFIHPGERPPGPLRFCQPPRVPPPGPCYGGLPGAHSEAPPHAHIPSESCRPLPHGLGSEYLHRPMRDPYINPSPCSNFSIDRSTVISLGSQQMLPLDTQHRQLPQWPINSLESCQGDEGEKLTPGEEFLRCLAANKPIPDFLKGVHLSGTVQAGVAENRGYERHRLRSNSRSPAKERTGRSKSRAKSQARSKSRARSRSRPRSRSRTRGKSRARSKSRPQSSPAKSPVRGRTKARSRSRSRGKSQVRSKSRARSRSRSHGKSQSRPERNSEHRDKRSPSRSCSGSSISSHASASVHNDLLQGLKRVINSKQLEDSMPSIKNAILTIQANNLSRELQSRGLPELTGKQELFHVPDEPKPLNPQDVPGMRQEETDSHLLPHERVGSDFSWLQSSQEVSPDKKPTEMEDEEDFLYGNKYNQTKQIPATQHFAQSLTQQGATETAGTQFYQSQTLRGEIQELKRLPQLVQSSLRPEQRLLPVPPSDVKPPAAPTPKECEKIKNMLKNIGLNMGTTEISNMMIKLQQQNEGKMPEQKNEETLPAASLVPGASQLSGYGAATVRQALESLQSIIYAKREKGADSNPHDGCHTQTIAETKKDQMKRKECLLKELAELLKQDGSPFLIPVIGFYCQKCEEFFGDVNTAESHSALHRQNEPSNQKHEDRRPGEERGHPRQHQSRQPLPSDRRDQRDPKDQRHLEYHKDQRHLEYRKDQRHPDLKRKPGEGPRVYRNDWEKMYIKEERPESPRLEMTNVHRHTPTGLHGRVKLEESVGVCDKMGNDVDDVKGKSTKGHKKKKKKKKKDEKKKKEKDEKKERDGQDKKTS